MTPTSFRKEFVHSSNLSQPFDTAGLFYYLGTIGASKFASKALGAASPASGTISYLNPHTVGLVHVSMSSLLNSNLSQPSQVIDHVPVGYNCTGDLVPSFLYLMIPRGR